MGILILFSKEVIAHSLSDFLYLGSSTQTIGTVTSIIDGDTIKVKLPATETTVRLLSIDTPELPDQPYSQEAKQFTSQLLNQPIKLYYSGSATLQYDKYGRLLAIVVKDDEIFNLKLLEKGLAVRMFIFNDIIKFSAWEEVEINARKEKLKIWSNINSQGIFINEINPNPYPESDEEAEFVELYNNNSTAVNVGNWTFVSRTKAVIPAGTTIPNNGYLIIARTNPTRFREIYPNTPEGTIIINADLILQNSYTPKENLVIHLKAEDCSYQDSLTYNLAWDNSNADRTGKTLERKSIFIKNVGDSKVGGVDDANWDASTNEKGTPGKANSVLPVDTFSYITITPTIATITIGGNETFTATGYDEYGNKKFIEGGSWEIESWMGSIIPITGTYTNFKAGISPGTGKIKYQLNQIIATATIIILPATHPDFNILKVYPNPFKLIRGDRQITFEFDGILENINIRIYDISGSLIKEIENISNKTYNWDVKDKYGKDVASGIYIYIVSDAKEVKKIGKIAIIR